MFTEELETHLGLGTFVEFIQRRTEDETLTTWESQWIILTTSQELDWLLDDIKRLVVFECGTRIYNFKTSQIGANTYNVYYYIPFWGKNE